MIQLPPEMYTVGWLCALPKSELVAARMMLDECHEPCVLSSDDHNSYIYGSINRHNLVIACLPPGQPGKVSAAILAQPLSRSFPNMKIYLFVGIGGGVPRNPPLEDPEEDIHLGDVVVGWAEQTGVPAVVQYDLRIAEQTYDGQLLGFIDKPDRRLLNALGTLMSSHIIGKTKFADHLKRISRFSHPGLENDRLFEPSYLHQTGDTCSSCDLRSLVKRPVRKTQDLIFHQGTILSGDSVIKNALLRDRLAKKFYNAMCFEMEAAGVTDMTHCLVIRGISDYSDSHKTHSWQNYAAAAAAAFAREFLYTIEPRTTETFRAIRSAS